MNHALLKYFVVQTHLFALLAVQHTSGEEVTLTGCTPLRSTTLERETGEVTVFECLLSLSLCDGLDVYINNRLFVCFLLQGLPVTVCPGPEQGAEAGRAEMVPW